jgi:4-hydroxy-3-polyprenylbenzoate decarboxylase
MNPAPRPIALIWTGASGARYGWRLLECLLNDNALDVWLLMSTAARVVIHEELGFAVPAQPAAAQRVLVAQLDRPQARLTVWGNNDWHAPAASGSHPPTATVICPCSMGTLAKAASGWSDDLIGRVIDVTLKERRPLIVVPRETPLSSIHLENMLKLTRAGAVILPACPGFYHEPSTVDDVVDTVVARILDHLGCEHQLLPRWGEHNRSLQSS